MNRLVFCCVVLVSLLSPEISLAQPTYCVSEGGSGRRDGSDWGNALAALPATLIRGATYYVAGGSYAGFAFKTVESGTNLVTVKKATSSEHGTNLGWTDAYAQGQSVFGPILIYSGFFVFDGVTGGGPTSWKSGHGFAIKRDYVNLISFARTVTNISVRHVEFAFPTNRVPDTNSVDHIYGSMPISQVKIERCYFHDSSRTFILSRGWQDVLVKHCYFARNRSTPLRHAEGWSDNDGDRYVIANNIWEDIEGTGVVVNLRGDCYDWEIYGNTVFWTDGTTCGRVGNGVFTTRSSLANAYNWKVYNNTVINGLAANCSHYLYNGAGNLQMNNVWYKCTNLPGPGMATADYQWFVNSGGMLAGASDVRSNFEGDPFVAITNGDFRLTADSPPGLDLTQPGADYDVDPNGIRRGQGKPWNRGAMESMLPHPPAKFRVAD